MSERTALVTGSTDGIGRQTAKQLAAAGMHVIVHGRSKPKLEAALTWLREQAPAGKFDGVAFDLGNLASVRRGAGEVLALAPALHVLVNNAGIFATERVETSDGIELTLAVNHVGPFLLTELLLPRLIESAKAAGVPSRVIDVASMAHSRGSVDDLELKAHFSGYGAYANSKLANVMHALSLSEQYEPTEILAYSLHPGVIATKLLKQGFGPVQGASLESGARTTVKLATSTTADFASGSYVNEGVLAQPAPAARDATKRDKLWNATKRLAKL